MIRRLLVTLTALAIACAAPISIAHAISAPGAVPMPSHSGSPSPTPSGSPTTPPPYPAVPVTMTASTSSPLTGEPFWVRISGAPGTKVFLTLNMPSASTTRFASITPGGYAYDDKVSAKGVIGSNGYAQFWVTIKKPGNYTISGSTPTERRTLTVRVREHMPPANPVGLTASTTTPPVGQAFWVRMSGAPGTKVFLTLNMPSASTTRYASISPGGFAYDNKVSAKGVIDSNGYAQFWVTIKKPGNYTISGSTPTERRELTVNVRN